MICVLPIRGFGSGMQRLRAVLDDEERAILAEHLAGHVIDIVETQAEPVVVTSDDRVEEWSRRRGVGLVRDEGEGLSAAAAAGIRLAADSRWAVLHADLPYLQRSDLEVALAEPHRTVLAPTHDGGTSLIVGQGQGFPFAYGAASFRRHLARAPAADVVVRVGLALDLDTPRDLARYRRLS